MNCEQFEQLLDQYLDNELKGSVKLEFETHMVNCEGCGHLFAMSEAIGQIIAEPSFDEPMLSEDFSERVLNEIEKRQQRRRTLYRIAAPAGLVASVAIILMGIIIFSAKTTDSHNRLIVPVRLADAKVNSANNSATIIRMPKKQPLPIDKEFASVKSSNTDPQHMKNIQQTGIEHISQIEHISPTESLEAKSEIASSLSEKQDQLENSELNDELNTWLTNTLERAGLTVWELAQLKTLAWDKMREGLIDSLKTPSLLPAGNVIPINPIINNSADISTPQDNEDVSVDQQGLELI